MFFPFGAQNHRYWQEHEWEMLALNWLELLFFQLILLLFWLVIKGYCLSYFKQSTLPGREFVSLNIHKVSFK